MIMWRSSLYESQILMCRLILGGYYFCLSWAYISSFLYGTQKDFPWQDLKVLHLSLPVHPLIALLSASPVSLWKCINMKQSHANLLGLCVVFSLLLKKPKMHTCIPWKGLQVNKFGRHNIAIIFSFYEQHSTNLFIII